MPDQNRCEAGKYLPLYPISLFKFESWKIVSFFHHKYFYMWIIARLAGIRPPGFIHEILLEEAKVEIKTWPRSHLTALATSLGYLTSKELLWWGREVYGFINIKILLGSKIHYSPKTGTFSSAGALILYLSGTHSCHIFFLFNTISRIHTLLLLCSGKGVIKKREESNKEVRREQ